MFQSSCTAISMQQLLSLTWRNGNNQEFTSRQRTFYDHSPLAYKHTTTRKMVQAQHHLKKRPRTPHTVAQNGGKVFTTARERISAQGRMPNKWTACCIHRVPVHVLNRRLRRLVAGLLLQCLACYSRHLMDYSRL